MSKTEFHAHGKKVWKNYNFQKTDKGVSHETRLTCFTTEEVEAMDIAIRLNDRETLLENARLLVSQIEINDYQTSDGLHDLKMNDGYLKLKKLIEEIN